MWRHLTAGLDWTGDRIIATFLSFSLDRAAEHIGINPLSLKSALTQLILRLFFQTKQSTQKCKSFKLNIRTRHAAVVLPSAGGMCPVPIVLNSCTPGVRARLIFFFHAIEDELRKDQNCLAEE